MNSVRHRRHGVAVPAGQEEVLARSGRVGVAHPDGQRVVEVLLPAAHAADVERGVRRGPGRRSAPGRRRPRAARWARCRTRRGWCRPWRGRRRRGPAARRRTRARRRPPASRRRARRRARGSCGPTAAR